MSVPRAEYDRRWAETFAADVYERSQVGRVWLRHHIAAQCAGHHCPIHNPSDHPMREFPLHWRPDRQLMERVCEHGVGHPDPDHLAFVARTRGAEAAATEAVHGCDGCCRKVIA